MADVSKNWEKLYLVLDREGYGLDEFASLEEAYAHRDALAKKNKKSYFVAKLTEVRRESANGNLSVVSGGR